MDNKPNYLEELNFSVNDISFTETLKPNKLPFRSFLY